MDKPGERLNMLQRNNQQLSAELARVREENQRLDKSLAEMRGKQTEYSDTLAGVDRIWQQLTKDMEYLANRFKGFPVKLETDFKAEPGTEFESADPFLRRLISYQHPQAQALQTRLEEIADDATEVEKALAPRSAATFQAFATLVDLHEKELAAYRASVEAALKGPENGLKEEFSKLREEASNLRREMDAQQAISRTAEAQLLQLTDMLKKDEQVIQDLNNELADKREEVNAVNRKLHTLKSVDGSSSLASQASLPLQLVQRTSLSPVQKQGDGESSDELKVVLKELKFEKERADGLARQLREMQGKLQDESFVQQTSAFQIVQRQMQAQVVELDKARRILETLQRECEGYKHSMQGLVQQAEDGRHQRRMLHLTEERVCELEIQLSNARTAQDAAELALQQEKQKFGSSQTLQELKSMVAALEIEAQASRAKAAKRQSLLAEIETSKREARVAISKFEAAEAEAKQLRQKMEVRQTEYSSLKAKEEQLKGSADDLRVFVEVLQSFCDDPRELAEVRASEVRLQNQIAELQKQLEGTELQAAVDKARAAEEKAKAQVEALEQHKSLLELEAADLKRQCKDLDHQVSTHKSDTDAYTSEMEAAVTAYEEIQVKNSRLQHELTEKEERCNQLQTEKTQAQHSATRLAEQLKTAEAVKKSTEQQAVAVQERVTALEARLQEIMLELGQARERVLLLAQQIEKLGADLRERDMQIQQRDAQLATMQSASEQRKRLLDEEAEKLQRERSKRQRLEEEKQVLQSKVEQLVTNPGSAAQEELEGMRLMTRCRVCHVRSKDTVLTKCMHTFCRECVLGIIGTRNRKCPACGQGFGCTEFKQIYL